MGRDDVPEQHFLREVELVQHPLDDGRGRLGRARPRQLTLGREREPGNAGASVPRGFAGEKDRRVPACVEVRA
jgi:hypothetical protein